MYNQTFFHRHIQVFALRNFTNLAAVLAMTWSSMKKIRQTERKRGISVSFAVTIRSHKIFFPSKEKTTNVIPVFSVSRNQDNSNRTTHANPYIQTTVPRSHDENIGYYWCMCLI